MMYKMVNGISVKMSDEEEEEKIARGKVFEEERLANAWETNRQAEYPSIKNVVIALAEKEEGFPHFWNEITAQRLDVKSKYPKPK